MSHKQGKLSEKDRAQAYKGLANMLTKHGYTVRREKLRQGFGWKAHSGSCTALDQQLIFVDSRMPIDEQIAFLITRLLAAGINVESADLEDLPKHYSEQLLKIAA